MKKQSGIKRSHNDIKLFIDFFHDAALRIRKQKPTIIRGKDGRLVERALLFFSRSQLEMLSVWFLVKKTKMSPTIGAMLSDVVLEELSCAIRSASFWKDLDTISEQYFSRSINVLPIRIKNKKTLFSRELDTLRKNLL